MKILDKIIEYFIDLVTSIFDIIIYACQSIFCIDLSMFEAVFPGAKTLYGAVLGASIGLLCFLFFWSLLKSFKPGIDGDAEHPALILFKAICYLGVVMFARQIIGVILAFGNTMFQELNSTKVEGGETTHLASTVYKAVVDAMNGDDVLSGMDGSGLAIRLVAAFFSIYAIYTFCKLTASAVKNYVFLGVFSSVVCLPAATGVSKATESIWKKYLQIIIGQMVILYMNLWFVKVGYNAITQMHVPKVQKDFTGAVFGAGGILESSGAAGTTTEVTNWAMAIIWCLMIGYLFNMGYNISAIVKELGIGMVMNNGRSFIGTVAGGVSQTARTIGAFGKMGGAVAGGVATLRSFMGRSSGESTGGNFSPGGASGHDAGGGFETGDYRNGGGHSGWDGKTESSPQEQSMEQSGTASDLRGDQNSNQSRGAGQASASKYRDANTLKNNENGIFSNNQSKQKARDAMQKALTQKMQGEAASKALRTGLAQYGAMATDKSGSGTASDAGSIVFDCGSQGTIPFTDVSTDGAGSISGKFGTESVEMFTKEAAVQSPHIENKEAFFRNAQKIDIAGAEMYIDRSRSPMFASHIRNIFDDGFYEAK